jgi:hypothetical protein
MAMAPTLAMKPTNPDANSRLMFFLPPVNDVLTIEVSPLGGRSEACALTG